MAKTTLTQLKLMKQQGEKIAMLTCYDATFAHVASTAGVDMAHRRYIRYDFTGT
jgi:3-methyl-2-oxobutanoate hydroxymethyltransferase